MKIYNSATRQREDFIPNHPDIVKMYTCGPTVYHFAHIGNLRSYIMEDVLEKFLRYSGYNVKRVMNITDVGHLTSDADEGEDKMLKGAKRAATPCSRSASPSRICASTSKTKCASKGLCPLTPPERVLPSLDSPAKGFRSATSIVALSLTLDCSFRLIRSARCFRHWRRSHRSPSGLPFGRTVAWWSPSRGHAAGSSTHFMGAPRRGGSRFSPHPTFGHLPLKGKAYRLPCTKASP